MYHLRSHTYEFLPDVQPGRARAREEGVCHCQGFRYGQVSVVDVYNVTTWKSLPVLSSRRLVIGNTICSEVNWSIINIKQLQLYIIYICSIPFSHQASLGRCLHHWGQHQGQYWILSCFYYDLASPLLHIKFKMINWSRPLFMLEIVLTGHQWQCPDLWPRKLRCSSCPGKPRLYLKR